MFQLTVIRVVLASSIAAILCGCVARPQSQFAIPSGYEIVTEMQDGSKWYYAPGSVNSVVVGGRGSKVQENAEIQAKSVSVILSRDRNNVFLVTVDAYVCGKQPGSYLKRVSVNGEWDGIVLISPFNQPHFLIWKKVCG